MNKSLRALAAYEVASGVVALAYVLRITRLPPAGGAIAFNVYAVTLCLLSVGVGAALWRGRVWAWWGSVAAQALQLIRLTTGHLTAGLMVGAEVLFRIEGADLSLFANLGLSATFWRFPEPQPSTLAINLLALAALIVLWKARAAHRVAAPPANESLKLTGELE